MLLVDSGFFRLRHSPVTVDLETRYLQQPLKPHSVETTQLIHRRSQPMLGARRTPTQNKMRSSFSPRRLARHSLAIVFAACATMEIGQVSNGSWKNFRRAVEPSAS